MNKKNLDQALAALADALYSGETSAVNASDIIKSIPKQSLSGDLISGGKITKFASAGITDRASKEQIAVQDDGVLIRTLNSETFSVDDARINVLTVDTLNVKDIKSLSNFSAITDILFSTDTATKIIKQLPKESISGDMISGGKITKFLSTGIADRASREQVTIQDDGVLIRTLKSDTFTATDITTKKLSVDTLDVKTIVSTSVQEREASIVFSGDKIYGKGLLWYSKDYNKQFVFNSDPDRFFSSENIDLSKGKYLSIDGIKILDSQELGPNIVKSNLREVGNLKGLVVDGEIRINNYMFYNPIVDRLGIGTDVPNAALSVAEMGVEVMLGTDDEMSGMVGTFAPVDFNIVTDNTPRITIAAAGNIVLGNPGKVVSIPGKLGIGVKNPDQNVDLHVVGPVRLNNHIQMYADAPPTEGTFTVGDIVYNTNPGVGKFVGWVCTSAGVPGTWHPFGEIKDRQ